MEIWRKYNQATTIIFPLIDRDTNNLLASATLAAGDFRIMKDEGALANTNTTTPTDEGGGMYSLALTATEMSAARIAIVCVDQTAAKDWEDTVILISTYGHASATHEFDLDTATQNVNVSTISNNAITAAAIATDAIDADAIADNAINAGAIAADAITAAKIADGAIDAATFAAGAITASAIAADAIGASELAADAVAEIQSGLATAAALSAVAAFVDTEVAAILADTDDIQSRLPAALVSGRIDASVGAIAANAITAASMAADASAEIADAVWDEAQAGHVSAGTFGLYLDTEVSGVGGGSLTETGIADAILSRPISNVEGSAAFRTLAGAIAKLVNRVRVNGASFEVYKTNDTDLMGTQTATTDGSAEAVVELNTD